MTDNVISFKVAKKRANYVKKELKANENRKKFGRTKSAKNMDEFDKAKQDKHLDDHNLSDA